MASNDKNISDIDYKPCKLLSQISIRTFLGAFLHTNAICKYHRRPSDKIYFKANYPVVWERCSSENLK